MGYWGSDILDGDTPCDCIDTIRDILGPPFNQWQDDGDQPEITAKALMGKADEIVHKMCNLCRDDVGTGIMVFGQLAVNTGAKLSREHLNLILKAIQDSLADVESQGWRDPHLRKMHLRKLATNLGLGGPMADDIRVLKMKMIQDQISSLLKYTAPTMKNPSLMLSTMLSVFSNLRAEEDMKDWDTLARTMQHIGEYLQNEEVSEIPLLDRIRIAIEASMDGLVAAVLAPTEAPSKKTRKTKKGKSK